MGPQDLEKAIEEISAEEFPLRFTEILLITFLLRSAFQPSMEAKNN